MRPEVKRQQPLNMPQKSCRSSRCSPRDNASARREAVPTAAMPVTADTRNRARRDREETRVLLTDVNVEGRGGREEAHRRGSLAHTAVVKIVPTCRRTHTLIRRRGIALRIQLIFTHKHVRPSN